MGIAFSNNLGRIIALGLGLTAVSAAGQDQAAEPHWQRLTRVDIDAAQRMLLEDHPGSVEARGDAAFRQRLAAAYAAATARARRVTSSEGYFATLAGFAAAMGDKHIWSRPLLTSGALDWAGIVIARRGNDWVVADENEAVAGEPLAGARLVACDGIPADRLAEQRLGGFRAVWSIGAQRTAVAPLLLTDDGNTFLTRPARCAFEQNGQSREIELRWRNARRNDLNPRFGRAVRRGEAGFGVRRSGDGYWIGLQSLGDQAGPVVEAVRTQAEAIRRAPYVVLDLRGNSGGNSAYGDQIAEALLGGDTLRRVRDGGGKCNTVWRLSDRNLRHLEQLQREIVARMGAEQGAFFAQAYRDAVAARAAGRDFSGPTSCAGAASPPATAAPPSASLFPGRLVLLTDHVCFSSCLLVTERFRRLGALHAGEETDAATRYFEVREDRLPSGLSMFSTLQALSPDAPPQIGPFAPEAVYEGDISDTAALEAWIASLVRRRRPVS